MLASLKMYFMSFSLKSCRLTGDGAVCLRVVIDVVVSTVTFQFITGSTELFNRLLSWVHYVPPIIILYTKIHKSQQKIHKNTQITKQRGMPRLTEIEEKKEYLRSYEKAVRQMERSAEKIKEIRLGQIIPAADNDGMPHARNSTDLSGYAALLDAAERQYMSDRYQRLKICKEITDKIERMDNEDEKDVLTYRYIRLMKWESIAVRMNCSWKQVHRIHARSLKNFKMDME